VPQVNVTDYGLGSELWLGIRIQEELIKRPNDWKDNVENKGMRVNMNKTKVIISGERQKVRQKAVRWPCRVCIKCGNVILASYTYIYVCFHASPRPTQGYTVYVDHGPSTHHSHYPSPPGPTLLFQAENPPFSANPSHHSLLFSSSGFHGFSGLFTDTSDDTRFYFFFVFPLFSFWFRAVD